MTSIDIHVLYFASAREDVGLREEIITLSSDKTLYISDLRTFLCNKYPEAASSIQDIAFAKNLEYSDDNMELNHGDEVALIPPISGG